MVFQWLKRQNADMRTAEELYGRVVAAARQPRFYSSLGVADTPEGRFELVALHLFLALESLKMGAHHQESLTQRTIEAFVTDMDDCMREMGVGDLTVPKRVKRAAAGFYERAGAYRNALSSASNQALERALAQYAYSDDASRVALSGALATYVRETAASLKNVSPDQIFVAAIRQPTRVP